MTDRPPNPPITLVLKGLTLVEVLVLLGAGGGLFFLTDFTRALWPWDIPPFNARFLGAVYLASMVSVGAMLIAGRWAPARMVLPMLLTFTFTVLVISLVRLEAFVPDRWGTWGWFLLYVVIPLNAAAHIVLYRQLPPADRSPVPMVWRVVLLAFVLVLGIYGVAELAAPEPATAFWPWRIDAFHGQMYSAVFLTAAVGALWLSRAAARAEYFTLGVTYAVLGFFAILGLITVDASAHRVDWTAAGTWLWLAVFAATLIAGLALMGQSRATGERA